MKAKPPRKELEAKVAGNQTTADPRGQNKDFYNLCIESAPYGILVHDDKGKILIFNSQMERISGYRREEIPDIKTWINKLYPDQEYRKLVVEERKKAASKGKLREREALITTKAGQKSLCRFSSLQLNSGIRIVFIKNFAGQQQAEALLQESEERFRLLSEAAFEAVIIHKDGVLLKANDQFFKMFEYRPEELLGTQVTKRVIADESIKFVQKQVRSKASTPYEAMGKRKDGRQFPITCHAKTTKYQGSEVRVVAIRDLSYRKESEQALRESEEKFRTVSEKSPNMIFIYKGPKIVYVNQKCEEMMGYKKDEVYAPEFDFLSLIAPESMEKARSNVKEHAAGREVPPCEYGLIKKNGNIIDVIITTKLINFESGQATLGIVTDITDRKKAENALREKDRKLEQQAQHLEEINTALKVLLEHREQEKKELEENLLANIKKLVFPYLEKLDNGKLGTENQTYLNIIKSNLNDLISPLANRLSSNYLALTPTEIQITDFIKHGKTSKEIAAMLNVSAKAVAFHRGNIRKKLDLTNKKINLQTYLQSLPQ